jgi:glutamine synthetase
VNEFDPLFEEIYDFCEAQEIGIDTLIHEAGAAQMEFNFDHGAPLKLADQAFLFKRTVREAGLRHKLYATFMAKPMQGEPGSSMHVHQSVVDAKSGRNLFGQKNGKDTELFHAHIAGLQKYLPAVMPLLAPNVNSYRRLIPYSDAPINTHWGYDNRTVGFRVPHSEPAARRVENRIAGADANPYLALAATLACGYLGMTEKLKPRAPVEGSAYRLAHTLPRTLYESLENFTGSGLGREICRGRQDREGDRAPGLPAGDLVLGTRASSAKRLAQRPKGTKRASCIVGTTEARWREARREASRRPLQGPAMPSS